MSLKDEIKKLTEKPKSDKNENPILLISKELDSCGFGYYAEGNCICLEFGGKRKLLIKTDGRFIYLYGLPLYLHSIPIYSCRKENLSDFYRYLAREVVKYADYR